MPERLLITTSTFPLAPDDGSPRFVLDLAEALGQTLGVTVLAPGSVGSPERETWGPVDVVRFPYFRPERLQRLAYGGGMPANLRGSLLAKLQVPGFLWAQRRAVRRLTRDPATKWVNSHWMIPQGLAVALARGRSATFRHVLHIHAADVYLLARLPGGGRLARFVLGRTDAVLADGSHVRDALDRLIGRPSGAVLQPNGVWTEAFRPKEGETGAPSPFPGGYLLFVGRFVEKKGVTYLLQALKTLREARGEIGLVLVGYGPLEQDLRDETARLDLEDAVLFAGPQPHEEVVRYLRGCAAAVVPSIIDRHGETEGMPTVVVEAMAAGCRVVASAVDGIPDVVRPGENGWLCNEKDAGDLAAKLKAALDHPADGPVAQSALATAAEHDWQVVADHYLRIFSELGRPAASGSVE